MQDSTTYQAILRKGREEGKAEEATQMLLKIGRASLGPPEPGSLAVIESISDVTRIEELAVRLLRVSSWEELLAE